jgi:hypothetical protein
MSKHPPLCKVCGKPVPKLTRSVSFVPATLNKRQNGERGTHSIYLDEELRPTTVAEAMRYSNEPLISVQRYGGKHIGSFNTWDGESYVYGGHFHAQGCAAKFGEAMARQHPTMAMPAYHAAIKDRGATVKEPA